MLAMAPYVLNKERFNSVCTANHERRDLIADHRLIVFSKTLRLSSNPREDQASSASVSQGSL
jgi:hypothetical protein